MKPESSLTYSHRPAIESCAKPDKSVNFKCVLIIAIFVQDSFGFWTFSLLVFEKEHYISRNGSVHVLRLKGGGLLLGTFRDERATVSHWTTLRDDANGKKTDKSRHHSRNMFM